MFFVCLFACFFFFTHFTTKDTKSIRQNHSALAISAPTKGVALVKKRDVEKNPAWRVFSLGLGASVESVKNLEDKGRT